MVYPTGYNKDNTLIYPDGVEPIVIRTTDRTNFKKCRRLFRFSSNLVLNLESVTMNKNLAFGIAIHRGAEGYYNPSLWSTTDREAKLVMMLKMFVDENNRQRKAERDAYWQANKSMSDEREQEYKDREELGLGMLRHYWEWAHDERVDHGLTPIYVEQKFQVPVLDKHGQPVVFNGRPLVYQVRIDLVMEDADGGLVIVDHKTAGSLGDTTHLDLDTQVSSYGWAAQLFYKRRVRTVMYNELRKAVPKPPRVLKNGTLSKDKKQLTTYKLYVEAIDDLGLDPAPYRDMLDSLRAQEGGYFRRTPIPRSQNELALQGQFIVDEALDMVRAIEEDRLYPSPAKFNCQGCDFAHPSLVANELGDVDFVLNNRLLFQPRRSEDELYAEG